MFNGVKIVFVTQILVRQRLKAVNAIHSISTLQRDTLGLIAHVVECLLEKLNACACTRECRWAQGLCVREYKPGVRLKRFNDGYIIGNVIKDGWHETLHC